MRIFRNHNEKHEKLFLQFLRFKWDKNEVNFYFFKTVRIFREGQEEYTRKNFARSFPHSIHKDFSHCFRFLCTQHKKKRRWKKWRRGKFMKQFSTSERVKKKEFLKKRRASMWKKILLHLLFFWFLWWKASNRAKIAIWWSFKGKTNWKTFFRTLLARKLSFVSEDEFNEIFEEILHFWKELIAWGNFSIPNWGDKCFEKLCEICTHTCRLQNQVTLGENIVL